MKNTALLLLIVCFMASCSVEKTVKGPHGKMMTEKQWMRYLHHVEKIVEKKTLKDMKGEFSKEQLKRFKKSLKVNVKTSNE